MLSTSISHLTLIALRTSFFLGCRRYVHQSLLIDLKRVIKLNHHHHPSTYNQLISLKPSSSSSSEPNLPSSSSINHSNDFQLISSTIATLLFCWSFCEGSLLFSIVILGSILEPQARNLNWNLSLGLLISSVVFIVPFLECLLFSTLILSRRRKTNERIRLLSIEALALTLIPFGIYLFVYYRLGQIIQGSLGVETGSHSFGFLNTTLARICVPGVILIALLSGGGAVNTAWLTWEWRHREKEPPITDQHIAAAEASLSRTQTDLAERKSILEELSRSNSQADGSSLMSTLFTGSSNPKTTQLQQEISGLTAMEAQIINDINALKERKAYNDYSRTIPGMMLNLANWFLSVYCVYRLFMACVNLIFGYVRQPITSTDGTVQTPRNPTTDVVTYLVAKVLYTFSIELEITKLTRLVGLVLIGSIIVVNLRSVLVWVHRVFNRVSSAGISSSLMLLVLGQLMSMYLLTCLISLPSSSSPGSPTSGPAPIPKESEGLGAEDDLLNTLPSFSRFSKLFDLVFLSTGILTFFFRWLIKQLNYHDPSASLVGSSSSDDPIALNRLGAHFV